jgi:ABC-type glycerol-3-phosphate transport system substrate-binding protein
MSMNYSLGNQIIAEGKAAMVMQGIWVVAAIQQYNPRRTSASSRRRWATTPS